MALRVIEHLPSEQFVPFLVAARAKLGAGGRLIMETVNPHAPPALKHFWIDPTHQHDRLHSPDYAAVAEAPGEADSGGRRSGTPS